jgi:hypothetical protein
MGGFAVATTVAREDKARSAAVAAAAADDDDDETAGLLLPSLLGRRDVMTMPSSSAILKYLRDEEYDEDDSLTVIGRNIMLARKNCHCSGRRFTAGEVSLGGGEGEGIQIR